MSIHIYDRGARPVSAGQSNSGTRRTNINIENAAIVLATSDNKNIFMLLGWDDLLSVPGGMIDPGERPFVAMTREFKEEVGQDLPCVKNIKNFDYHDHTRVYYGQVNERIRFTKNNEKKSAELWSWRDIIKEQQNKFSPGIYWSIREAISRMRHDGMLT